MDCGSCNLFAYLKVAFDVIGAAARNKKLVILNCDNLIFIVRYRKNNGEKFPIRHNWSINLGLGNKISFMSGNARESVPVGGDRRLAAGTNGRGKFQFTFRDSRIFASFALLGAILAGAFLGSVDLPHIDVRAYGALVGILAAALAKSRRMI